MRIIAGRLGGRTFDSPGSFKTHPMSDKMRGALFNVLGDISGLTVLDVFAGSGALSFEALSRGAHLAVAIDSDRDAQRAIGENIAKLGLGREVKLIRASANAWLQTSQNSTFDLVLCDPPYNDLQPSLLAKLALRVSPHGLLVLSYPVAQEPPAIQGMQQIDHRTYGDATLTFYRSS